MEARVVKAPSPAFQFYPKDWLSDINVMRMTCEERGAYWQLIAICWIEGSIPNDPELLTRLTGANSSAIAQPMAQFKLSKAEPSKLIHERLEREREKQLNFRTERSESGKRGAKSRWTKTVNYNSSANGSAIESVMAEPMANDSFPVPSSHTAIRTSPEYKSCFDTLWSIWPRHEAKEKTQQKFLTLCSRYSSVLILERARRQVEIWQKEGREKQFIPMLQTWLNQKRFDTEPEYIGNGGKGNGNEQSRQAIPERTKINQTALEVFREYEARRNSQPSDSDGGSDRRKTVSGGPDSVR